MAEPIDLVYIGDKPVKKDTVTLSDLAFPRMEPVPTPAEIAHRLLRYPDVWRKASELAKVKREQEAAAKAAEEEAARLAAEEAARLESESMVVDWEERVIQLRVLPWIKQRDRLTACVTAFEETFLPIKRAE